MNVTADVPLTIIRYTGLDRSVGPPVSSKPLKNTDSGSAKNAVRNDGTALIECKYLEYAG